MEIPIKDVLMWALPAFLLAVALIAYTAYRSLKLSRTVRRYQDDIYRQNIEHRINELQQQLIISKSRFETVNHLLLEGQKANRGVTLSGKSNVSFFDSLGVDLNEKQDENLVFVIMPFNNEFNMTYRQIKNSVEDLGLKCKRGDEEMRSAAILPYIIQEMIRAKVIIADITGRNPNVFYELGIAHALNKPVLMISQSVTDIPFDVSSVRVLVYNTSEDLRRSLNKWLLNSVRTT